MNVEQAMKIAEACREYWDYHPKKWAPGLTHLINMDGRFNAEELEAFACLLRNKVSPNEDQTRP